MAEVYIWILLLMQILFFGYCIKKDRKADRECRERNEELAKNLAEFKAEVSERYVKKEDYNRNQSEIIRRLDKLQSMLMKVLKK
ncbi:MAG: hypothetical protein IJ366_09775 [Clostridia bacterium]|nr:hypothetical protein [Clostridia bacterium]